jgi:hypothetical protein
MTRARETRSTATGTIVVLGDDDRLTVAGDPWLAGDHADLAVAWDRLVDLARIAETTLDGAERRAVLEVVFGGLSTVLEAADAGGVAGRPVAGTRLRAALETANARMLQATQRRARQRYLEGMLIGLAVVLAAAGVARLGLVYVIRDTVPGTMYFPTILVAGAFGGFVSVLTRITRGSLHVPSGGRNAELRLLGMFRPIVGVVVGTALAILLLADVLPLKLPPGDLRPFWVVGLAFVAGFAERFAQEISARSPRRLPEPNATEAPPG